MSNTEALIPSATIQQLMDVGAHYGHRTSRWNPAMEPYIYGVAKTSGSSMHIIDLRKTMVCIDKALKVVYDTILRKGKILFVGTKAQSRQSVKDEATRCGQFFINYRWLGGMLTNWRTVSKSIKVLKNFDRILAKEDHGLTKKEFLKLGKKRDKLHSFLGGIEDMRGVPDLLVVMDSYKDRIAIREARVLSIPVICIVDTNSNPRGIDLPIPANDDLTRGIKYYTKLVADTILVALEHQMTSAGIKSNKDTAGGKTNASARIKPSTKENASSAVASTSKNNTEAQVISKSEPKKSQENTKSIEKTEEVSDTKKATDGNSTS